VSFLNWVTQLGFETEGLILIVGAAIVLFQLGGIHANSTLKVILIVIAAAIQAVMPYFGHATMVKVLRALIIPFVLIFAAFAYFSVKHGTTHVTPFVSGWEVYMAGLAFVIALSGLGWTECGNDYTRYLPRESKKGPIIGWIFLSTALPEIVMMTLGALTFTFLGSAEIWNGANPFQAFIGQHYIPSWFTVIFLLFAIVQLFGINSLDLYSSGVSIQAMGIHLKRYQAVVLDSVICCGLTIYATFASTFSQYMKIFVGVIIVWIAPWFGIFITDWILRKFRYNSGELQRNDSGGLYYGKTGFRWTAITAFVIGVIFSTMGFSKQPPPINFPFHWMTPIANHFGAFYCDGTAASNCGPAGWFGGADFSIYLGIGVAAVLYLIFEGISGQVKKQMAKQRELEPQIYS
jgi:purine-cytosine permease-like protein